MAFLSIPNVAITGISACVPKREEFCSDFPLFSKEESLNFSKTTGVISRRIASPEICSSDLCYHAAKLLSDLQWNREEIDCLVFVTQTPDYHLPATSPLLQNDWVFLKIACFGYFVGCSGYVYGLSVITSLLSHGNIKKGYSLREIPYQKHVQKTTRPLIPCSAMRVVLLLLNFKGGGGISCSI